MLNQQLAQQPALFDRQHRTLSIGIIIAISLVAFEGFALTTMAPLISRDLGGTTLYGWIFSAFLLAQILGTVIAGQWVDRHGPTLPFIMALILFAGGLLIGAVAPHMLMLIAGRAIQGLGGGALVTCIYTIISLSYTDAIRPRILAAISSAYVLPALIGPTLAGLIAEYVSWRAVFYGFLPFIGIIACLAAPVLKQIASAVARSTEMTALSSQLQHLLRAIALVAGTALLLAGFTLHVFSMAALMIGGGILLVCVALSGLLLRDQQIVSARLPAIVVTRGLFVGSYLCTETFLVVTLTSLDGLSVTTAGLALTAGSLSWTGGTWLQERLDKRARTSKLGERRVRIILGVTMIALSITGLMSSVMLLHSLNLVLGLACWMIAGFGIGLAHPSAATLAFAHAPEGREGGVSSLILLADLFMPAISIGIGGVLIALGLSSGWSIATRLTLVFGFDLLLIVLSLLAALRLPHSRSIA